MAYYLGIDGGGTKTRCVLADEANVLATSVAGGSSVIRLGEAQAREALHTAIRRVCETAHVATGQIRAACVGVTGAARPEIAAKIQKLVAELDPHLSARRVDVVGDTMIALQAAFASGPGVITIAGTGSVALGRDASGRVVRSGGWGFAISDEGSGYWIGRQAVSAVMWARDEQRETLLTPRILEAWKLKNLDALVLCANATPPPEFPRLFPVVLGAADEGDAVAIKLLRCAAHELVAMTALVVRQLVPALPHVPVAMTGSVFRQSAEVRRVFYNQLHTEFPGIEIREELVEPVLGALALARAKGSGERR